MNETDCEKIEEKLAKHFNSHISEKCIENEVCDNDMVNDNANIEIVLKVNTINNIDVDVDDDVDGDGDSEVHDVDTEFIAADINTNNGTYEQQSNSSNNNTYTDTTAPLSSPTHDLKHKQQLADMTSPNAPLFNDGGIYVQSDCEEVPHPLSERWSPLGANYDDALSPTSELLSPESELELLSSDSQENNKKERHDPVEMARLRNIEEEQEFLTSSLLALTSHFAHVQLRVRQIVEAPSNERDQLLKDLEEFAFRGIPESLTPAGADNSKDSSTDSAATQSPQPGDDAATRQQQFELINHLKSQLSELEKFAYESGAPVLPQHMLLEKQKIIIDELKQRLNLKVEEQDLPELSPEELKSHVDHAIGEFVGPLKMKEQLVAQLKTQITDLERFIAFLQCDADDSKLKSLSGNEKFNDAYNSYAAKKKKGISASAAAQKKFAVTTQPPRDTANTMVTRPHDGRPQSSNSDDSEQSVRESLNSKAHGLMDKASLLMQMFATTHFGAKSEHFQKNTLKKTSKGNHWGDLRAQLEVDIQEVGSLAATLSFDREKLANMRRALKKSASSSTSTTVSIIPPRGNRPSSSASGKQLKSYAISSDSDDETDSTYDCYDWEQTSRRLARQGGDSITTISKELTTAVRKNFCMTLQRLIQHGLRVETESATSSLIVPFMRCLNPSPVLAGEQAYRNNAYYATSHAASTSSFVATAASTSAYGPYGDDFDEANGYTASTGLFGAGGSRAMHAWELILEYYYLKHGEEYNNTPARKLSQSFNLDIVDAQAVTKKQSLLSAIGTIIAMHRPYKRSFNAHFKAFVCAGLNSHQLVEWLNLIFSCNDLIDAYYTPNSYVVRTGFRDSLRSIDSLSKYDFDLPVDLAVRHFRNI